MDGKLWNGRKKRLADAYLLAYSLDRSTRAHNTTQQVNLFIYHKYFNNT